MRGKREQIDAQGLHVDGDLAERLDRVGMDERSFRSRRGRDLKVRAHRHGLQEHRRQEREDQKDPLHRPPSEPFSREEAAEARQNWLKAADLRTTVDSLGPGYNGPSFLDGESRRI